jgi:hypothetical protein
MGQFRASWDYLITSKCSLRTVLELT